MTRSPFKAAFLRQTSPIRAGATLPYPLVSETTVVIGRDPRCQIILDSKTHGGVGRQHAKITPSTTSPSGWQICDLASTNGTFINGQQIWGCRDLQEGDRIRLTQEGPQFVFELQVPMISPRLPEPPEPVGSFSATQKAPEAHLHPPAPDAVTFSQLFPIVSTGRDLTRKAYLIPGILTAAFVVLMFWSLDKSVIIFIVLLATYISGGAYYFIYQLCGKSKPWWLLVGTGLMTIVLLLTPVFGWFVLVFRGILPGSLPETGTTDNFLVLLVRYFFGAGLLEELLKALPIFIVYFMGTRLRSPNRELLGVWEPLDGILLGTASAVGFTLFETLLQYVPDTISSVALQSGQDAGLLIGIQLLIPRILGSISGHMAYSGYFGYFIGLSVLRPRQRWQILSIGYLTAASLHALWNATGLMHPVVLAVIGSLSYAFLAAAILKARALSPNREQNFATRFTRLP
jgi:RsiW-degrading membrane proteinase PrsW (M82 family)